MPHNQSYTVTAVPVKLPQPHLNYATRRPNHLFNSGWCAFVVAGVFAFVFLVCVFQFGGQKLFPAAIDPSADLVPILKQGSLQAHPFLEGTDLGVESRYFSHLPPRNLSQVVASLDALFQAYPASHEAGRHRNCWLENPTTDRPCFFDVSWLAEGCTKDNGYGYEEKGGHFSPCFILRLEKTGDWKPRLQEHNSKTPLDHYDPGFSPVHCNAKGDRGRELSSNLTLYPPKGFSHLFFPASRFDPQRYLPPMVAVKLHGVPRGTNLTVQCSVVTPNAFFLLNNGRAVVQFEAA